MSDMPTQHRDTLEALVDRYSMAAVVHALARIADAKADHLETNWQDRHSAAQWTRVSARLDAQVPRIENLVGAA